MRTLTSYSDLDSSHRPAEEGETGSSSLAPVSKSTELQGDARTNATMTANEAEGEENADGEEEVGEDLTHEEIWDDSALIKAWDEAAAEAKVS